MIYEPQEDSYLLNKYVKKLVYGRVLDMGTGSGIQAIAARENTKYVVAVDIDLEAVAYTRNNGLLTVQSDLFTHVNGKFDWIIFNPPYLPEDTAEPYESKRATTGGEKGSEILKRFLREAKKYLVTDGKILLVISSLTGDPKDIFCEYKYTLLEEEAFFFERIRVYLLQATKF